MTAEDWAEVLLAAAMVSAAVLVLDRLMPDHTSRLQRSIIAALLAGGAMFLLNILFG